MKRSDTKNCIKDLTGIMVLPAPQTPCYQIPCYTSLVSPTTRKFLLHELNDAGVLPELKCFTETNSSTLNATSKS